MSSVLHVSAAAAAAAKSLQLCPTVRPHRRQPTRLLRAPLKAMQHKTKQNETKKPFSGEGATVSLGKEVGAQETQRRVGGGPCLLSLHQ